MAVRLSADGSTLAVSAPDDTSSSTTIDGSEAQRSALTAVGYGSVHVHVRAGDGRWTRQAYLKVPEASAKLGSDIALSPDGDRLVAGAYMAKGVEVDFGAGLGGSIYGSGAGRVYQFDRGAAGQWQLSQSVAIADGRVSDNLGAAVAMSDDTQWVVAGSPGRDYGDVTTPAAFQSPVLESGAAYVFRRDAAGQLLQHLRLRAPLPAAQAAFGKAVAISADGLWIAVGAPADSTDLLTLQPVADPLSMQVRSSGAVHVYRRTPDGAIVRFASLKAPVAKNFHSFGRSIALSADGSRMVVGADLSGHAVETELIYSIGSSDFGSGDVYVYRRTDSGWTLETALSGPRLSIFDRFFGYAVDLSADGRTLAVGMPLDNGAAGLAGAGALTWAGTVRLYQLNSGVWTAGAVLRPATVGARARLGKSVALSRDGLSLAAGAPEESTPGAGIDPPVAGTAVDAGAAYVFRR